MNAREISLPLLDLDELDAVSLMMATADQRWRMVERVFSNEGRTTDELPTAWAGDPLQAWCWLVLVTNGIEHDDSDPRPLVHYGIDLGFSSTAVRRWVWTLA